MKAFNLGLLLLAIGVVYLLGTFGIINTPKPELTSLWPLIPLLAGLNAALSAADRYFRYKTNSWGSFLNGLFWTVFGGAFLVRNLGVLDWHFTLKELFWPILLVWLGIQFIGNAAGSSPSLHKVNGKAHKGMKHHQNTIGELRLQEPWTLTKNSYNMWVGEMFIDVTKAFLPERDSYLELKALAGEVTIVVPKEMAVEVQADIMAGDIKIMGQHENGVFRKHYFKSPNWEEAEKRITIYVQMKAGDITVRDV